MQNQKTKGRPPKQKGTAKREHFSVWVSADQKSQINQMIEKSGLSASQFFLTLALDIPFKKPQKRSLPKPVADTVRVLEQLSGILSLAVLKTKGQQMLQLNGNKAVNESGCLLTLSPYGYLNPSSSEA